MELSVIGALAFLGALLIKLISKRKAQELEVKSHQNKSTNRPPRLEPSASLPIADYPSVNYCINRHMLSNTELAFYNALQKGLGDQYLILAKVRVCDVLQPQTGITKSEWQSAYNRVSSILFDFVLYSLKQNEIITAFEITDNSYSCPAAKKRNNLLNAVCESANFPLMRVVARQSYAPQEIKTATLGALREYSLNKAA